MTVKRKTKAAGDQSGNIERPSAANTLEVDAQPGEHHSKTLARLALDPGVRHAELASVSANHAFGDMQKPSIMGSTEALPETMKAAEAGDKRLAGRMLDAQAVSLDTMFTELARRSARNMGEYVDAADRYMRLALKAQIACRRTLEALTKLHQPREQTVKHVCANEGGQAVFADQFHQYTGGGENGKTREQSHTARAASECPRCLAKTRKGTECQSPAVRGKRRCRMHGGTNPGAPESNRNAWNHGGRSAETRAAAQWIKQLAKEHIHRPSRTDHSMR